MSTQTIGCGFCPSPNESPQVCKECKLFIAPQEIPHEEKDNKNQFGPHSTRPQPHTLPIIHQLSKEYMFMMSSMQSIHNLQIHTATLAQENQQLRSRLASLTAQLAGVQKQRDYLQKSLNSHKKKIKERESCIRKSADQINELQDQIRALQEGSKQQTIVHQRELKACQSENSVLQRKAADLTNQTKVLKQSISSLKGSHQQTIERLKKKYEEDLLLLAHTKEYQKLKIQYDLICAQLCRVRYHVRRLDITFDTLRRKKKPEIVDDFQTLMKIEGEVEQTVNARRTTTCQQAQTMIKLMESLTYYRHKSQHIRSIVQSNFKVTKEPPKNIHLDIATLQADTQKDVLVLDDMIAASTHMLHSLENSTISFNEYHTKLSVVIVTCVVARVQQTLKYAVSKCGENPPDTVELCFECLRKENYKDTLTVNTAKFIIDELCHVTKWTSNRWERVFLLCGGQQARIKELIFSGCDVLSEKQLAGVSALYNSCHRQVMQELGKKDSSAYQRLEKIVEQQAKNKGMHDKKVLVMESNRYTDWMFKDPEQATAIFYKGFLETKDNNQNGVNDLYKKIVQ